MEYDILNIVYKLTSLKNVSGFVESGKNMRLVCKEKMEVVPVGTNRDRVEMKQCCLDQDKKICFKFLLEMMVCTCYSSAWEVEVKGRNQRLKTSLCYTVSSR